MTDHHIDVGRNQFLCGFASFGVVAPVVSGNDGDLFVAQPAFGILVINGGLHA